VVTPVFSASYSGLFKTFFDVLESACWTGSLCWWLPPPVPPGTPWCSSTHSGRFFAYLHAVVVPTGVFAATDDFGDRGLDVRVARAAGELAALMGKVSLTDPATSRRRTVDDEFADPTPFDQLLQQASSH